MASIARIPVDAMKGRIASETCTSGSVRRGSWSRSPSNAREYIFRGRPAQGLEAAAAGEGPGWSATAVDDPETSVVLWAATAQVPQHGSIGFLTKYPLSLHRLSPDGLTPLSALAISACRDVRRVDAPRQPGALCREARLRSVLSEAQPFTEPRAVIKCGMSLGLALQ